MQRESLKKIHGAVYEIFGKERKLEKSKKSNERMVSVKRLVLEIATRKISKIYMLSNTNVKAYFSVIIISLCRQSVHFTVIN